MDHPFDVRELAMQVVDAPPVLLIRRVVAHAPVLLYYALLYGL